MEHRHTRAIGGRLTAAALTAAITTGCSAGGHPQASTSGAPGPSQSAPSANPAPQSSATASAATPAPAGAAGLPRCIVTDLSPAVHLVSGSQATGHELLNITLTNTSGHVCFTYGFPGLQLEDRNSDGQATNVIRDFAVKPATLVVDSGASVSTTARLDFSLPAADEPKTGPCEAPSVYLAIVPPQGSRALSTSITGGPVTVCNHGTLDLTPLVTGTTGPNQ